MVKSFCHCFSNQEELAQGVATKRTYHAFCIVSGDHGAIEFSFRTRYIDKDSAAPFTIFYSVEKELEEDGQTSKKVRIHSKKPLADTNEAPSEKPFLRSTESFYSYTIDLHLHKLRSFNSNPSHYLNTIHSKDLYQELKAIYTRVFKEKPSPAEEDHWSILID
ncbi:hypothetical protein SAMN05192559_106226 [Halobacillus karajensis]|uniref:Uncharacterized protein n=1 Tax=Halobacillus karajensis TaxID=195088 RepID=A0A024P959_9BACI|nr:hypothetical protein [Halobacillus karajensis]CDQ20974.1 hypothetical protein BN982_03334 [Halobacillus karajensis]CDQ24962.1 hypothetical protein BN983_03263 [Halobacillus karajensis]CDQ28677.1 hypothetical protein BN981_02989 [Halobacillus karajensis]SEH97802.1 hypothetical protein SAMN05192559_106226 [Halobacillus karajensis]